MLNSLSMSTAKGVIVVFSLIVISIPFQRGIDNIRGKFRSVEESLYLSSSSIKKLSFGYKEILADIYWMRAIQYFGKSVAKTLEQVDDNQFLSVKSKSDLLYHYFDIISDLDPRFVNAYRYGGTFLAEPPPIGLGDIEKGIILFDKGRRNNPANYHLPLEEAFVYYLYVKNYEKAADLFREASQKPGLSDLRRATLEGMAASSHSKGGNRELSRRIWKEIYDTTTNEGRKEFALKNLKEIDTMNIEDRVTEALREYVNRYNKVPKSLEALKEAGIIKQVPREPLGGEFIIVDKLKAVKSSTLLGERLRENFSFLTTKAQRFRRFHGRYPKDLAELRGFIENETTDKFPSHPLGEEYVYNPDNGTVGSK
jgi:tetratricopeptide (TPR) repeat protein